MLQLKKTDRRDDSYFIGDCPACNNKRTFSIEGYCTECGVLHSGLNIRDTSKTPEEILEIINNNKKEIKMKTKNTNKKGSKLFKGIGMAAGKVVGFTFGTTHFVLQTSADFVAASEGYIQEKLTGEDATDVALSRKMKTAETQIMLATKVSNIEKAISEKTSEIKEKLSFNNKEKECQKV